MKILDRVFNPREIRRRLGMNQEQFWTQIGVTQSGGSRYESGREMPRPVKELLRLVHVEQIDLSQVKRVDFEIISYLKESHPDLYRNLRRAVKGRQQAPKARRRSPAKAAFRTTSRMPTRSRRRARSTFRAADRSGIPDFDPAAGGVSTPAPGEACTRRLEYRLF